ncbi:MAG: ATP-dependent Clp protease ATP-binding subunit ClpX [Clostridiales bacterium]|nr:ATP-dependent Clp protease ATP-binding subunit ClpX [Clostridiales bacterium]
MTDEKDNVDKKETKDTHSTAANEYEEVCSICRRSESKAGHMTHYPGMPPICDDCMEKMMASMPSASQIMQAITDMMSSQTPVSGVQKKQNADSEETQSAVKSEEKVSEEDEKQEVISAEKAEEEEETRKEEAPEKEDSRNRIPHIDFRMIDLSQLGNLGGIEIPQRQKVKKKKGHTKPDFELKDVPAPHKIKAMLDEYVVGQEKAKKTIAVAVYNHYKRILSDDKDGVEIEKSNMLLIGPTGSGKTYLVKTLARLLDVPLAIADATSLTEAGYIGDDIESVLSKLLAAADNDVDKAERGIVFIDEIDKIAKKKNTNTRDVSGESVQQELLKMLEGSTVEVPVGAGSKNGMVPMTTMDTRNILFICGGAFPDLREIIEERLNKHSSIGFQADLKDKYAEEENLLDQVQAEDLRKFGMIPEFLGRLPIVVTLQALTKDFLVKILKEPKNAILKQYKKLLSMDEVELVFDDGALEVIAEKALEKKTGARALRAILEEYMLDIMYEIPKDSNIGRVTITREYLENRGGPVIELRGQFIPEEVPLIETK